MSHGQKIAQNAMWLMGATMAQKVIAFVTFTVVARWLGAEVTGQFFYAVSITSIFVVLTDLGLTPVVIREMAADETRGWAMVRRALAVKATLIPIAIMGALTYAHFATGQQEVVLAVALACFVMSLDAVSLIFYGILRGQQRLRFEALGMFVGQCVTAALSITAVFLGWGVYGLIAALIGGSLWNVAWGWMNVRRRKVEVTTPPWKELFHQALPFALAGIFVKVYSYVDTLLLRQFHHDAEVGYYAVAYKVTYALQFLPLTFVAALYPSMSAVHAKGDHDGLKKIFSGSLRLMMLISAPIAALLSGFAPRFIPLIYGQAYAASIAPMSILPWVLIPIFLDFPIGSLLNATRRASRKTTAMGVAMVINIIGNLFLVPLYGSSGAAISGVVTFIALLLIGGWFVRKDIPSMTWAVWLVFRGVCVAAIVWFAIRFVAILMPLPMAVLFTGALALVLLLVTRLFSLQDLLVFMPWLRRRTSPLVTVADEPHDDV